MDRLDRVRQLLDLVVASVEQPDLDGAGLAGRAYLSRFHFDRLVAAAAGEPPGAFRRRLLLERAAHRLATAEPSVTGTAVEAGYTSVAAFSRAFTRAYGRSPSAFRAAPPARLWLPASNGVHFHPPGGLRLPAFGRSEAMNVLTLMLDHDRWLTDEMIERAGRLTDEQLDRPITVSVGHPERRGGLEGITDTATLRSLLAHLVRGKETWVVAVRGQRPPARNGGEPAQLRARHATAAAEFSALVRSAVDEGRAGETFIDVTCEPPETFTYAGMVAHVLTFSAYRRTLALGALIGAGVTDLGIGNPIGYPES
jgi:AraC-like DNA-binding protein